MFDDVSSSSVAVGVTDSCEPGVALVEATLATARDPFLGREAAGLALRFAMVVWFPKKLLIEVCVNVPGNARSAFLAKSKGTM